jgi:hypothetical protein
MKKSPNKQIALSFNPKQAVKKLLSTLPPRAQDIVNGRFGLGGEKKMTLEAIGRKYKITRERVRQIENYALNHIRKSENYEKESATFANLKEVLRKMGSLVSEDELLESISKDRSVQNQIHFLLTIGKDFSKEKEDLEFKHRWHIDKSLSDRIHDALRKLYENLEDDEILQESEIVASFLEHLKDVSDEYRNDEVLTRWLAVSKNIGKNPLGEWGKAKSSNIRARGIKDYAYLVIRRHGSPVHFKEVARLISEIFNKKAHVATTHNELIKDPRFVLVGRGLYALREWGYQTGIVREVIRDILKKEGPLPKDKVVDKVLKERHVKENTVLVNLQNPKYFRKNKEGEYTVVS